MSKKTELRAVAIGPDRVEIVVGHGSNEELASWYKDYCNIPDQEWVDYQVNDFPMDKQLEWEEVGEMTLRELIADVENLIDCPMVVGWED